MSEAYNIVYEDSIGVAEPAPGALLSSVIADRRLAETFMEAVGRDLVLTPPQMWAVERGFMRSSDDFLIATPTNSGKSFLATLRMMHRAAVGKERTVLVVPLKALAEEKATEARRLAAILKSKGGPKIDIKVSTGDYVLSDDFMGDPPPDSGDIVICTPERLEIILRNPGAAVWTSRIRTVIIDELHLLGDRNRGATIEILLTRLLASEKGPAIVGLSATLGGIARIRDWMASFGRTVHLLESDYRYPQLGRRVLQVADKTAMTKELVAKWLSGPGKCGLVFVFRKSDADRLAAELCKALAVNSVASFHAGLTLHERSTRIRRFLAGESRVLVCTTTLKMGINTPADEVLIRDTLFHGVGRLDAADLSQMLGRAGRQARQGFGTVLEELPEVAEAIAASMKSGRLRAVEPQLLPKHRGNARREDRCEGLEQPSSTVSALLSLLVYAGKMAKSEGSAFLSQSFSGFIHGTVLDVGPALLDLERCKLVYQVENSEGLYSPTKLGRTTCLAGLSPESGAIIGGFLRALIQMAEKERVMAEGLPTENYLRRLTFLDLLFLAVVSYESRDQIPGRLSKADRERISQYIEQLPPDEKPLVNLWRSADSAKYPTRRLLSSLRFLDSRWDAESQECAFARVLHVAIMLHRHANGSKVSDLCREYGWHEGEFEGGLKFAVIWVLSSIAQICDGGRCYKLDFLKMRCFELIEQIKYGSTLGKLLGLDGVGPRSIEKLLAHGYGDLASLQGVSADRFTLLGLDGFQAKSICALVSRRNR